MFAVIAPLCLLTGTLAALGMPPAAQADALYRWTDAQGVPHFSDRPPHTPSAGVEQLVAPVYQAPALSADRDPYSILNQATRLEASRRQQASERLQRQEREREDELRRRELATRQQAEQPPAAPPFAVYPRPVHPPPAHHPSRPGPSSRPWSLWQPADHPAYRPHTRPSSAVPRSPYGREGFEPGR